MAELPPALWVPPVAELPPVTELPPALRVPPVADVPPPGKPPVPGAPPVPDVPPVLPLIDGCPEQLTSVEPSRIEAPAVPALVMNSRRVQFFRAMVRGTFRNASLSSETLTLVG